MIRDINITLALSLLRVFVQFLGVGYLSRVYGKTDLGLILLLIAITRVAELFLVLGDNNVIIRDGISVGWKKIKKRYFSIHFLIKLLLLSSVVWALLYFLGDKVIINNFKVAGLVILFLFARVLFLLSSGILVSKKKFFQVGIFEVLILVFSQLVFGNLLKEYDYVGLLAAYVIAYFIVLITYFSLGFLNVFTDNTKDYSRADSWRFARPEMLNIFARSMDTYFLPSIVGVETMTSYKRGYSVGEVVTNTLGRSFATVLFPSFAEMTKSARRVKATKYLLMAFTLGLIIAAFVSWFSFEIIEIYLGTGWEDAAEFLQVMVFILPARLLAKVVGALLKASDLLELLQNTQYILILVQIISLICALYSVYYFMVVLITGTTLTTFVQLIYWYKKT